MATAGRQRIDRTKLMEYRPHRQSTFSKRRQTVFAKAGDLSACCGVDTAAVVFSECGTAFAFGSPSVDDVLRRLVDGKEPLPGDESLNLVDLAARRQEVRNVVALLVAEKARMKAVGAKVVAVAGEAPWWEADTGALGEAELPEFETALRKLRAAVSHLVDEKADAAAPG